MVLRKTSANLALASSEENSLPSPTSSDLLSPDFSFSWPASSSMVTINVLPIVSPDEELDALLAVEIEAHAPLPDVKKRIRKLLVSRGLAGARLVGLFRAEGDDHELMPLNVVSGSTVQGIQTAFVRRENYLRLKTAKGACTTANSCVTRPGCLDVVAVIFVPPDDDPGGAMIKPLDTKGPHIAKKLENFVHGVVEENTLPPTLSSLRKTESTFAIAMMRSTISSVARWRGSQERPRPLVATLF